MNMIDFDYDGKRLSDYGCIIVSIVTSFNDSISLNSNIIFDSVKNKSTHIDRIITTDYESPSPVSFDICKNKCISKDRTFTDIEISHIMRWLNKKQYKKFKPIYDDGSYTDIYYEGSFNVSAIKLGGEIIGLTLSFIQNSPFAYTEEKILNFSIKNKGDTFSFYNTSDEDGYLYPLSVEIELKGSGTLNIKNIEDNYSTNIKNCKSGEIITFDCKNKIIKSNIAHSTLPNDFNYNYPRFISSDGNMENICTVSIPCDIKIVHSLVRKVGIII